MEIKSRCYAFSISVIKFVSNLPNKKGYWIISDQVLRSATSVGANLVEAMAASSTKDFIKFYQIALKSANETKYWFGLLRDATDLNKDKINILLQEVSEISKIIAACIIKLKKKLK